MGTHPIENIMQSTMEELKKIIDVDTIVGSAVQTLDGSTVIPVSKISFGFVSGGAEYGPSELKVNSKHDVVIEDIKNPFGGGSGAGVSLNPVAFLIVRSDSIKILPVQYNNTLDRVIENIPEYVNEIKNAFNGSQSAQEKTANAYYSQNAGSTI
ncbi:MAG: GerW family sporulation protein [Christensenellales bacterium]